MLQFSGAQLAPDAWLSRFCGIFCPPACRVWSGLPKWPGLAWHGGVAVVQLCAPRHYYLHRFHAVFVRTDCRISTPVLRRPPSLLLPPPPPAAALSFMAQRSPLLTLASLLPLWHESNQAAAAGTGGTRWCVQQAAVHSVGGVSDAHTELTRAKRSALARRQRRDILRRALAPLIFCLQKRRNGNYEVIYIGTSRCICVMRVLPSNN